MSLSRLGTSTSARFMVNTTGEIPGERNERESRESGIHGAGRSARGTEGVSGQVERESSVGSGNKLLSSFPHLINSSVGSEQ